jgi:hypothetical protein
MPTVMTIGFTISFDIAGRQRGQEKNLSFIGRQSFDLPVKPGWREPWTCRFAALSLIGWDVFNCHFHMPVLHQLGES